MDKSLFLRGERFAIFVAILQKVGSSIVKVNITRNMTSAAKVCLMKNTLFTM